MLAYLFLSTLPARGATHGAVVFPVGDGISIHAPREGSDSLINAGGLVRQNFYPRSPRGERLQAGSMMCRPLTFLSTLPARGATQAAVLDCIAQLISIHAPREGSDPLWTSWWQT